MHLLFDHRLTDPTIAAVRAALRRALSTVNGKRKSGSISIHDPGNILPKRATTDPEGVYFHHGTRSTTDRAAIALAWWTAPGSGKLVRIRGWREPYREWSAEHVQETNALRRRAAVWHLDPERITISETKEGSEYLAVCGCGAAGSPESLAWGGGMCGPCRDRIEEHGSEFVSHEPALLTDKDFTPTLAAFSADNARIIAAGEHSYRVWDRSTEQPSTRLEGIDEHSFRSISPDGRYLVVTSAMPTSTDVYVHDLIDRGIHCALLPETALAQIHWSGRGGELLIQRRYDGRPVRFIKPNEKGTPDVSEPIPPPMTDATLSVVRPDAKVPRAVFCEYGSVAVTRIEGKGEFRIEHEFRLGVGQLDRTGNWTENGPKLVRFTADGERLLFVSSHLPAEHLELWNPAKPKALLQVTFPARIRDAQFSPDGEHLFILGEDGTVFVCHPGLLTHVRARFRWHAGQATSLAVSPDSKTIATTSNEGVKLWPVARLLEVL